MSKSTFPTVLENIRSLSQLLDLKIENKKALDDAISEKNLSQEKLQMFLNALFSNLNKLLPEQQAKYWQQEIEQVLLKNYLLVVSKRSVFGLSREEFAPLLIHHYFTPACYLFLQNQKNFQPFAWQDLLNQEAYSVPLVLAWLEQEQDIKLSSFFSEVDLHRWKKSEHLPSCGKIKLLPAESRGLLLIARALDEVRNSPYADAFFKSVPLWAQKLEGKSVVQEIHELQTLQPEILELINQLNQKLNLKQAKPAEAQNESRDLLDKLKKHIQQANKYDEFAYSLDWFEARWQIFSGDLAQAVACYKRAFDNALYCAGEQLQWLIQEALVASAFYQHSSGKKEQKFIAHLKNAAVVFQYELSALEKSADKINVEDKVAHWEIELWAQAFPQFFPAHANFTHVNYKVITPKTVALGEKMQELSSQIKIDYTQPNKWMKFGLKKLPQLTMVCRLDGDRLMPKGYEGWNKLAKDKLNIVQTLLQKGADVNKLSPDNESALLMALQCLQENPTQINLQVVELLLQHEHSPETLNSITTKKQLYPLMLAVEIGRVEIIKQLLAYGAKADMNTHYHNCTPLFICMKELSILLRTDLSPAHILQSLGKINEPEYAESLRRAGASLGMGTFYTKTKLTPEFVEILNDAQALEAQKTTDIQELYQILGLLLEYGADPNHVHHMGKSEYTPLMFAVENNDQKSYQMMLAFGGDPKLKVRWKDKYIDCQILKDLYKSDQIPLA